MTIIYLVDFAVVRVTRTRSISCSQKTRNTSYTGTGSNSYQSTQISKSQRKWAMVCFTCMLLSDEEEKISVEKEVPSVPV